MDGSVAQVMDQPEYALVPASEWETWTTENDAVIIDVREPFEWVQGVLPGSNLVRLEDLPQRLDEYDPDQAILLVCRTGSRSGMAALFMAMRGYTNVGNLTGGLADLGMA